MRRLRTARSPDPDDFAEEGFDRADLEGDAIGPVSDEISWLRPFGTDIEGLVLADPASGLEPEAARVPRQARELVSLGRRLDALLLLQRYLDDAPRDAAVRALLADFLDDGDEPERAIEELTTALADASDPIPMLVRRGAILARRGRTAEAEQDMRNAIRQRAGYAPAHLQLGLTLLRRGLGADAADALREALRLTPGDPDAMYYLGEAQQSVGDLDGALRTLEQAAALAPSNPRAYKLMGRLLDRLGRTDDARVMHQRARSAGTS
jgi:tetratricopeptide (TPR) repeat protein